MTFLLSVNGEQGMPTGHIEAVNLEGPDGTIADLVPGIWPPSDCPRFSRLKRGNKEAVRVSRRVFEITGYSTWVGNWCWDQITVTLPVGRELIHYLRSLKWHNEGGTCEFGDIWDSGMPFRLSDLAAMIMTPEELATRKALRRGIAL